MALGEWDQRQLCPDGGCVGVIGPDGTCKVCGRAAQNWGDERKRGLIDPDEPEPAAEDDGDASLAASASDGDDDLDDEDEDGDGDDVDEDDGEEEDEDDGDDAPEPPSATSSSPGEWGSRQLCPDGSCIGLIGADGACKVCGRSAQGPRRADASDPAAGIAAEPAVAAQPGDPTGEPPPGAAGTTGDPESMARTRCSDPACAGVTGPDGHCEACGKLGA